jgi:predicted ATP-grasp superfamily ATP-dependent carboligase
MENLVKEVKNIISKKQDESKNRYVSALKTYKKLRDKGLIIPSSYSLPNVQEKSEHNRKYLIQKTDN